MPRLGVMPPPMPRGGSERWPSGELHARCFGARRRAAAPPSPSASAGSSAHGGKWRAVGPMRDACCVTRVTPRSARASGSAAQPHLRATAHATWQRRPLRRALRARVSGRGSMISAQAVLSAAPIAAVAARRTRARPAVAARRSVVASLPAGASSDAGASRRVAAGAAQGRVAARASRGTAAAAAAFGKAVAAAADGKGERPVILVAEKLGKGGAPAPGSPGRRSALGRRSADAAAGKPTFGALRVSPLRSPLTLSAARRRHRPAEGLRHGG